MSGSSGSEGIDIFDRDIATLKCTKISNIDSLQFLQNEIGKWSDLVFGSGRPPSAPLNHLVKEVGELIEDPYDIMEYADCFMLLLDSARKVNFDVKLLIKAIQRKLIINKKRKWGKLDKSGVSEHIRGK